jgi:hypothetical protein
MKIKCPHCEAEIDMDTMERSVHRPDHEVEIIDQCAVVYDVFSCPHCRSAFGRKMTSGDILDWYTEWEIL